jgi:hypothetical protein
VSGGRAGRSDEVERSNNIIQQKWSGIDTHFPSYVPARARPGSLDMELIRVEWSPPKHTVNMVEEIMQLRTVASWQEKDKNRHKHVHQFKMCV